MAKSVPIPKLINLKEVDEEVIEVLGMKIKNITTLGERSAAGLSSESGIWVIEIGEDSPANNILHPNDVILKINQEVVSSSEELKNKLDNKKGDITITISRNQKEQEITFKVL